MGLIDDPDYLKARAQVMAGTKAGEVEAFQRRVLELGQDVYMTLWHHTGGDLALLTSILESAWARAAVENDRATGPTTASELGVLVGLDHRLEALTFAVTKLYYPEWSRLLEEQDPRRIVT